MGSEFIGGDDQHMLAKHPDVPRYRVSSGSRELIKTTGEKKKKRGFFFNQFHCFHEHPERTERTGDKESL